MARRRIPPHVGRSAVRAAIRESPSAEDVATAVRFTLEELAAVAPGRALEVRVPPLGATQCMGGAHHRRGTPPAVVETDPQTWLALVTGDVRWEDAVAAGRIQASGARADLGSVMPLEGITFEPH